MAISNVKLAELMGTLTATSNDAIVEQAYNVVLGRSADSAGKAYWVSRLEDDLSPENLTFAMLRGVDAYLEANPTDNQALDDKKVLDYKLEVAEELVDNDVSGQDAQDYLILVTDATSRDTAIAEINGTTVDPGTGGTNLDYIFLTEGQDILTGTDEDDTFVARGNGSLDNADIINGGAGVDTIEVMLDNGETAESPLVMNVEILKVQAQSTTTQSGDNDVDNHDSDVEANIDAGDMRSVEEYWSEDSRADVTIEDVSRNSHITTLGMRETDPGDVDYNVYFDPENITKPGAEDSGATLLVKFANVLQIAEDGNPVENFETLSFSVGLTNVVVDVSSVTSYAEVADAIEAAAIAAGLDVSVQLQAPTAAYFPIDVEGYSAGEYAGTYTPILITNNGSGDLVKGTFTQADDATDGAYTNTMTSGEGATTPALTQTNVIFDRVGKNSQGGDFVAGSDSTGDSGSAGIQQFNIDVDRDSWLTSVASTNNWLEVMNIENIAENSDGEGSLKIDEVVDVRVINASTMEGSANITAELTEAVTAKYLDLQDDQANPSADNSEDSFLDVVDTIFSYTFGSNDDVFNLTLSNSNLAAAGTTNREDFVMEIDGNAGDDTITTIIGDGSGNDGVFWYDNSSINANLEIDGGDGNDTITTLGAGNFIIDGGNGNDTVYADNSGFAATWVVGANNDLLGDLSSQNVGSFFLVDGTVTVTLDDIVVVNDADEYLSGYEATADIPTGDNYTVTQLHINQAIKDAINNDDVLSKLLVAKDGPANTLVIESLIDGAVTVDNLDITVTTPDYTDASYTSKQTSITTAYQEFTMNSTLVWLDAVTESENNADFNDDSILVAGGSAISTAVNGMGAGTSILATANNQVEFTAGAAGGTYVTVTVDGTAYDVAISDGTNAITISNEVAAALVAEGYVAVADGVSAVTVAGVSEVSFTAGDTNVTATINATALSGTVSAATSDNTITGGFGNDVLVLGTGAESNDVVVYNGNSFGTDTVVNFDHANAYGTLAGDAIDFTDYLTNEGSPSGSTESEVRHTTTGVDGSVAGTTLGATDTNSVITFNDFVSDTLTGETWAAMTGTDIKNALEGTVDAADTYGDATGDLADSSLDFTTYNLGYNTDLVGNVQTHVLMVENDANQGEYKVFTLAVDDTTAEITSATLVGIIDFGETVTGATDLGDNLL